MPRNPRKPTGRRKGYRKQIGQLRKGQRPYRTTQESCGEVQMEQVENILPLETDDEMQEPQSPDFCGFDEISSRRPIRVLSLFDGLSVGRFCLKHLKIAVGAYFSSEVDKNALKLSKYNLGDEVQQIGCVTKVTSDVLRSLGGIDLLLAGPPCQDFSSANPDRKGFAGKNGKLFLEFFRIFRELMAISRDRNTKLYFLCENVQSMEHRIRDEITEIIGVKPSIHNANKFGYMKRPRIFWGNLPGFGEAKTPIGTAKVGHVQEILAYGRKANVSILPTLTTTYHSQVTGKGCSKKLPVIEDGIEKPLLTVEMEKAYGLPKSFTDGADLGKVARRELLGRAWCANTISELLQPLAEIFKTC